MTNGHKEIELRTAIIDSEEQNELAVVMNVNDNNKALLTLCAECRTPTGDLRCIHIHRQRYTSHPKETLDYNATISGQNFFTDCNQVSLSLTGFILPFNLVPQITHAVFIHHIH